MVFDIIDNQNRLIQDWIKDVEKNYKEVKDSKTIPEKRITFQNLNLRMINFYEGIYLPTIDITMSIIEKLQEVYEELNTVQPKKLKFIFLNKEHEIDISKGEKKDFVQQIFPLIDKSYKLFKDILANYGEILEGFFALARKNIEQILEDEEQLVDKMERRLEKIPLPKGDELVSLYTETIMFVNLAAKPYTELCFTGKSLLDNLLSYKIVEGEIIDSFPTQDHAEYHEINLDIKPFLKEKVMTIELEERHDIVKERYGKIVNKFKQIMIQS